MTRLRFLAASLPFLVCLTISSYVYAQTAAPEQSGPYSTLLIRNVTVIDGSGAPAFGPVNILVKNDRIDQITAIDAIARSREGQNETRAREGQNSAAPKPDREIDGTGMYVVPGLIDCHIHVNAGKDVPAEYIYKLLLGHGVTTIRTFNIGNDDPAAMMAEKRRSDANQIVAPRMYVYPFWGRGKPDLRFSSPAGAREIVREWHALGVDGIKIIGKPGLWPDVFRAIAEEARANNMGVAVHIGQDGVYPMNAVRVAADGASTIEHHYGYPESSFTTHTIQELPPAYNYSSEPDLSRNGTSLAAG